MRKVSDNSYEDNPSLGSLFQEDEDHYHHINHTNYKSGKRFNPPIKSWRNSKNNKKNTVGVNVSLTEEEIIKRKEWEEMIKRLDERKKMMGYK